MCMLFFYLQPVILICVFKIPTFKRLNTYKAPREYKKDTTYNNLYY